jgi:hypothetical protein
MATDSIRILMWGRMWGKTTGNKKALAITRA